MEFLEERDLKAFSNSLLKDVSKLFQPLLTLQLLNSERRDHMNILKLSTLKSEPLFVVTMLILMEEFY